MSKPFDPNGPEFGGDPEFEVRELQRACAELDGHIPDGYFETFSTKLADQLETELMETSNSNPGQPDSARHLVPAEVPAESSSESSSGGKNTGDASTEKRDEHSGLHEIKALASSARERIRRRSTEHDIHESMLASSSSGMAAVVLPDPERSSPSMPLLSMESSQSMPSLNAVSLPNQRAQATKAKNKPLPWLWIATGAVGIAAAAAIALVMVNSADKNSTSDGEQVAAASKSDAVETRMEAAPASPPPSAAKAAPSIASIPEDSEDSTEPESNGSAMPEGSGLEGGLIGNVESPKRERKAEERLADGRGFSRAEVAKAELAKKRAKEEKRKAGATASLVTAGEKSKRATEDDKDNADNKNTKGNESDKDRAPAGDINAILDEVAGGGSGGPLEAEEKEAKPDKKALSSSDVKRAMGRLRSRVNKCGAKSGFTGKVSTRFSVSPNGRVTKASAKGGDAAVNSCVKAAVKRAKFPTFEPPMASFSYPFLITD